MAEFRVTNILDTNHIEVNGWTWREANGNKVIIRGIDSKDQLGSKSSYYFDKLRSLILGNMVELKKAEFVGEDKKQIKCDVYLRGINIAEYF